MPSSISSSKTRRRRHASALHLALFGAAFAFLTGTTSALWVCLPHQAMDITCPNPDRADYYPAYCNDTHVDHWVLLHGQIGTAKFLRQADVLFLGNSRLMIALSREETMQKLHQSLGNCYLLGFGHSEHDLFPLDLIRRRDLHPKLVVINTLGFFDGIRSPYGEKVAKSSLFEAAKCIFEEIATYLVRSQLHKVLPHWLRAGEKRGEAVVFRSRRDGRWSWSFVRQETWPIPEGVDADRVVPPAYLDRARRYKETLEARGARVVLMFVPSQEGSRQEAEQIAAHLGVPLVAPKLRGLATFDRMHLAPKSAERFAAAFVAELEKTLQPQMSNSAPSNLESH